LLPRASYVSKCITQITKILAETFVQLTVNKKMTNWFCISMFFYVTISIYHHKHFIYGYFSLIMNMINLFENSHYRTWFLWFRFPWYFKPLHHTKFPKKNISCIIWAGFQKLVVENRFQDFPDNDILQILIVKFIHDPSLIFVNVL